jgi:hypothetical protein
MSKQPLRNPATSAPRMFISLHRSPSKTSPKRDMSEGLIAAATDTNVDISEEDPIAAADTTDLRGTWPTKGDFALSISNTNAILDSEAPESMLST